MIAVTGANGLLGSFIVRELIRSKKSFVALKRKQSDTSLLTDLNGQISWRTADVLDPVALEEAFSDVTHVIHAAAVVSFNPANERKIYDINVCGTHNVVNACMSRNVQRLLHVSSVAALGRQKGQVLIDENNKWLESSINSRYGESKYLAELEVFRAQEEGLSTVIVNPSVILAAADWLKSSAQLFKYVWDEKPFYLDANLNYVDVRDVAVAAIHLLDSRIEGERFIASAGAIPFIDFFGRVATTFGKKRPTMQLSPGTLRIAAAVETVRSRMMRKEPLLTKETVRLAGTRFTYDNRKITKTLNFEFQPIDATIQWCCAHYLNFIAKK